MGLSTKGSYGLRAMIQLALRDEQAPVPLRDIAQEENLSLDYLEQLVISLRRAGLVRTTRGPRGGFQLARPPDQITARQIVEALEGSLTVRECVSDPASCNRSSSCAARELWERVSRAIAGTLEEATLASLCLRQRELRQAPDISYAI